MIKARRPAIAINCNLGRDLVLGPERPNGKEAVVTVVVDDADLVLEARRHLAFEKKPR